LYSLIYIHIKLDKITNKNHFLHEIEGLRGILAMWVLLSHIMWGSGFLPNNVHGIWSIIFSGGAPVTVFICISGFVIFLILDSRNDSYAVYITKRFFRIYPIFIFTSIVGAILFILNLGVLGENYQGPNVFVRGVEYYHNKTTIFGMHAIMLHGLLPKLGAIVLNPPSWSISLEWQFYIIAPICFYLFKKNWFILGLFLVIAAIAKNLLHPSNITGGFSSTLLDKIYPFTIGILSYKIYQLRSYVNDPKLPLTILAIVLIISIYSNQLFFMSILDSREMVSVPESVAIAIWILVLLSIMGRSAAGNSPKYNIISHMLGHNIFQYLGRLSYSIYLIHQIVIFIFLISAGSFIVKMGPPMAFLLESLIVIPITLLLAHLANIYIEKPFINLGRKIAKRS